MGRTVSDNEIQSVIPDADLTNGIGNLGVFGQGVYQTYSQSQNFIAQVTGLHRVRVFGAGGPGGSSVSNIPLGAGGGGGGGGGFAIMEIMLSRGDIIPMTVGKGDIANVPGGTTSFGTHVSATGGNPGGDASGDTPGEGGEGGEGTNGFLVTKGGKGGRGGTPHNSCASGGGGGGSSTQVGDGGSGSEGSNYALAIDYNLHIYGGCAGVGGGGVLLAKGETSHDGYNGLTTFTKLGGAGAISFSGFLNGVNYLAPDRRFPGSCFSQYFNPKGGDGGNIDINTGQTAGVKSGGTGDYFCGGGSASTGYSNTAPPSGNGGFGGGGGGASANPGTAICESGKGGNGFIVVEW